MSGTSSWLLVAPVPGLQQTLGGLHYRSLLRYRLFMPMFPVGADCTSCQSPMDIFGDHALLCRRDPSSAGFQLRHRLVQQTLGQLLRQGCIIYVVEPQGLRLSRDEGPESGRGSGLTRPADILLYGWREDRHCCVDLVGVSPARGGWRDADSAAAVVEQAKRDMHSEECARHGFDLVPFGFFVLSSFGPAAQELLARVS